MLISSKGEKETDLSQVIDGIEIDPANNFKVLGITIDQCLKINKHISDIQQGRSTAAQGATEATGFSWLNTLRPRQNGRHFADFIFKRIILNENVWISIKISLKFVTKGPINIIQSLVQIMVWRRPGDKPLSEPMMVRLLMHICVTRPQWVKQSHGHSQNFYNI